MTASLHQLSNEELMTQLALRHDLSTLEHEMFDRLLAMSMALEQTCNDLAEVNSRIAGLEK